jgi:hypothetical protein
MSSSNNEFKPKGLEKHLNYADRVLEGRTKQDFINEHKDQEDRQLLPEDVSSDFIEGIDGACHPVPKGDFGVMHNKNL